MTGNLIDASVKADRGDAAAEAWLAARTEWLRAHDLHGPRVVVVDGEVLEIEVDGMRTYALSRQHDRTHDRFVWQPGDIEPL